MDVVCTLRSRSARHHKALAFISLQTTGDLATISFVFGGYVSFGCIERIKGSCKKTAKRECLPITKSKGSNDISEGCRRHPSRRRRVGPRGVDLPMSVGALAMSLSTIIVAVNAQLLRRLNLQRSAVGLQTDNRKD